ncbi:phage tail tape measure protein [Actinoplanes awajinensis]|uniref:Uncharacterized protein n=1 Tax=Actinoplanes awajinensis subsp. mycoplanecinus TaxID=135947 RepID=A0A124G7C3_9ACTN|nr:hypothetical protein [Actinoplanes awajinensis]KUL22357.1 hypothetical protein ADL15_48355 [Actinoplanes awajinensis subsp. mycoplanecinus]
MAGNTVNLEFAGDATKLAAASKKAEQSLDGVTTASDDTTDSFKKSGTESADLTTKLGSLGAGVSGVTDAFSAASEGLQAVVDIQNSADTKAQEMKRALQDVKRAQQDYNTAIRDQKQAQLDAGVAAIDLEEANLDVADAQEDYDKAVKKHGKNSDDAKRAMIDLKRAKQDVKQATEDSKRAHDDEKTAMLDQTDAQLDLTEAEKAANPPDMQKWADQIAMVTPLLSGLMAVVGLVTAAQLAWNAAQLVSPTTWIILGIVALIAIIVLIATKTTWFQTAWKTAWGAIKDAAAAVGRWFRDTLWGKWIKGAWDSIKNKAMDVWEWMKTLPGKLKTSFSKIKDFIFAPFKAAFNLVADAWNNTIGRLHWSVPGWVPGVGGNSISAPQLPHFHSGGVVGGPPGSEQLAVLQAGERVTPAVGSGGGGGEQWLRIDMGSLGAALLDVIAPEVARRGGRATSLGVKVVGGALRA